MTIIRTQHPSRWDPASQARYVENVAAPAGARILFVEWPNDPAARPVQITWIRT